MDPRRHLGIEGTYNIRDLGGYETEDGRQTRWRQIWRADLLHDLPPTSTSTIEELGLSTVIDLRQGDETAVAPCVFEGSSRPAYYHLDMIGEDTPAWIDVPEDRERVIAHNYCRFLDMGKRRIHEIIAKLASHGALPALYHCSLGQDRTGVLTALLLGSVGVSDALIAADYSLSARFLVHRRREELRSSGRDWSTYTWEDYRDAYCPEAAMLLTLQHIRRSYGGVRSYLGAIGLTGPELEGLEAGILQ